MVQRIRKGKKCMLRISCKTASLNASNLVLEWSGGHCLQRWLNSRESLKYGIRDNLQGKDFSLQMVTVSRLRHKPPNL